MRTHRTSSIASVLLEQREIVSSSYQGRHVRMYWRAGSNKPFVVELLGSEKAFAHLEDASELFARLLEPDAPRPSAAPSKRPLSSSSGRA